MKTIKITLFTFLAFLIQLNAFSQMDHSCGTVQNLERLKITDPKLEQKILEYEKQIQEFIAQRAASKTSTATIVIPTVIHVVYKNSTENISNTLCNQIIQVLNEDYGRTNSDTTQTPAVWKPIAANTGIQFCLAQRDPSGAPTTGIERRLTTNANFSTDDKVKFYAQGGLDAWDVTRYFNIWICDLTPGLGGYGEFPTGSVSNTFGNVTDYAVVGLGQWVATHEGGHCFNLRHIWGDDNGACTGSDLVSDTPNQGNSSSSTCPVFPKTDACTTTSPGIMFMNYMDYGGNGCKNLFTNGQAARVNAVLNTPPYNALSSSNGCVPVILQANDAGNPKIDVPNGMICSTTFTPSVQLRNWGTNTLTSVNINYQIDSNPIATLTWTGSVPSLTIVNVSLPSMTATAGSHTFKCFTTLPNTTIDGNNANDTAYSSINVVPVGQSLPFAYGFEPTTFPASGWTLYNPDASVTLARTTTAAKTGTASMWFNSINYTCNGCIDEITLPNLDLTTIPSPLLSFQVAYRLLSDPTQSPSWSDSLRVLLSTDCGNTWNQLYFKFSTALTTISPPFSTTPFIPSSPDWRLETINLSPYASSNNVLIKFKVTSDYENNLYIDDINITAPTGIAKYGNSSEFQIYPNPSSGLFVIKSSKKEQGYTKLTITDVLGHNVKEVELNNELFNLDLTNNPAGIYFAHFRNEIETVTYKIIVAKP